MSEKDDTVYDQVYVETLKNVFNGIVADLKSEDFNWERLLSSMVEDESPLEEVFSAKTLQLASLHLLAIKMKEESSAVEEVSIIKEE